MRPSGRAADQLRPVRPVLRYTRHAEGSVLVEFGDTVVLCNASVEERAMFLKGQGKGWVTAEYGMPRSTGSRMRREAASGRQGGRTLEIQLIGRALRAAVDLEALGERMIRSIATCCRPTAGRAPPPSPARSWRSSMRSRTCAMRRSSTAIPCGSVAAVSVGLYEGQAVLDLDYAEDSAAETGMNVVMKDDAGAFIELQGTAEGHAFHAAELEQMLALARKGSAKSSGLQRAALAE